MKRLLGLMLLCAGGMSGQITNLAVNLEGPCVQLAFNGPKNAEPYWFYYGLDSDPTDEFRTRVRSGGDSSKIRSTLTCDLPPSTRIYVLPETDSATFACTSVCTNCDFGKGPTDASCDAVGEPPYVETEAFSEIEDPALPMHGFDPDTFCTGPPDSVRTVTCEDGYAKNFSNLLTQASNADPDLCHFIEIPPGCIVKSTVRFPSRKGDGPRGGGIVIRTAGDPLLFPPPGVRIDPTYTANLARFEAPANRKYFGRTSANAPFSFAQGAEGYRFERIKLSYPESLPDTFLQYHVLNVRQPSPGGSVYLDLDRPGEFAFFDKLMLDLRGCKGLQGSKNYRPIDSDTIRLEGAYQITGVCTGGTATMTTSLEVAKILDTTPIQVKTRTKHGLPILERLAISSIASNGNGTSTVFLSSPQHKPYSNPGPWYIRGGDVIMVEGSGSVVDGQRVTVKSNSPTAITINADVSCTSNCGTIRDVHAVQLEGTGLPCLDGSHHFRVVDASTFELIGSTACGESSKGVAAYDPAMVFIFFEGQGRSRMVFDQVIFDCGGFPYRTSICLSVNNAREYVVRNSFFYDHSFWMPVDPVSGLPRETIHDAIVATSVALIMSGSHDGQIENNTFGRTHGIPLFNDSATNQVHDRTIRRNLVHKPFDLLAGHDLSDTRYYPDRHCFEAKSSERLLLEGFSCSGTWADFTPLGFAILLSPRGNRSIDNSPIHTADTTIRGLYVERSASAFELAHETREQYVVGPTIRVSLTDSLFSGLDFYQYRSKPSGVNGSFPSENFGGMFSAIFNATAHVTIARNSNDTMRGKGTPILYTQHHNSSMMRFDDNILSFNKVGVNFEGIDGEPVALTFVPSCSATEGISLWNCLIRQVGPGGSTIPDPLTSASGNVLIGGLEAADVISLDQWRLNRDSTADGTTITASETQDYFQGWGADDHLYPEGLSYNDRLNATFESPGSGLTGWERRPGYEDKGVDIRQLDAYIGVIRDVSVSETSPTSVEFSYPPAEKGDLSPEGCYLDYSLDPMFSTGWWNTGGRIDDGAGSELRVINLTDLAPKKVYSWRLSCPSYQLRGEFRTQ